jgi:hypothetical protein
METVNLSLIVEFFELYNIFAKGEIGFFEAGDGNQALVDCADAKNKLAEVLIVLVGEDTVEDAGPEAIDVQKQLPGFITTRKFIGGISRRATKGAWEER